MATWRTLWMRRGGSRGGGGHCTPPPFTSLPSMHGNQPNTLLYIFSPSTHSISRHHAHPHPYIHIPPLPLHPHTHMFAGLSFPHHKHLNTPLFPQSHAPSLHEAEWAREREAAGRQAGTHCTPSNTCLGPLRCYDSPMHSADTLPPFPPSFLSSFSSLLCSTRPSCSSSPSSLLLHVTLFLLSFHSLFSLFT